MFGVRIHGRAGQGVVTAAELLSLAAFAEGRQALAFPGLGAERTGAPVVAFCRVDDHEVRTHAPVIEPHALVVQDPTLLHQGEVFAGLRTDGYVLINSLRSFDGLRLGDWTRRFRRERLLTVPAWSISREHTGQVRPNAAMLGGLAALTGVVSLDAVEEAIRERLRGSLAEGNAAAARACYEHMVKELEVSVHA